MEEIAEAWAELCLEQQTAAPYKGEGAADAQRACVGMSGHAQVTLEHSANTGEYNVSVTCMHKNGLYLGVSPTA